MNEHDIVEYKVRRAVGIHALRKIGVIVAEEHRSDMEKARALRLFKRYGWIILLVVALLFFSFIGSDFTWSEYCW